MIFGSTYLSARASDTFWLSYTTCIGERDHFRSNGKRLKKAADVLQQDRANYHRYYIRDAKDGYDNFFNKRKNRNKLRRLLKNGYITPQLAHKIVTGNPLVKVDVYSNHIKVTDISENSSCIEDEAFIYSGETPIHPDDTFKGVFTNEIQMKQATLKYLKHIGSLHNFGFARLAREYGRLKLKHGIIAVYDMPFTDAPRKLVATWSNTTRFNDGHSSAPALSFFEFIKKEDGWHGVHAYVGALFAGTWGFPPDAKDIKPFELCKGCYAIKIKTGFSTMGWGSSYLHILLPKGEMIYTVFSLQTWSNNSGVGEGKKTDWETSLTFEAEPNRILPDILATQSGWKESKMLHHKTKYIYSPSMYRYLTKADAKKYAQNDTRAKALKNVSLLVKNIVFPSMVDKVVKQLGLPDKTVLPDKHDPAPEGQWFVWYINGTLVKILGDDYSSKAINWKAKTRAGILESRGGVVQSVYGVEVGADGYFNVRKKILRYIKENGIKNYKLVASHTFDEEPFSHFIRFKDPKTGLYVLFYFKDNILVKVYQGTFDITQAG